MRGSFVFVTGFFRDYWLPQGDTKSEPVLKIVREIIHAPEHLVKMYLDEKTKRLKAKHRDKFDVNFLESPCEALLQATQKNTAQHGH